MKVYSGFQIFDWIRVNLPPFTWNIILLTHLDAFKKQNFIGVNISKDVFFEEPLVLTIDTFIANNYNRNLPLTEIETIEI